MATRKKTPQRKREAFKKRIDISAKRDIAKGEYWTPRRVRGLKGEGTKEQTRTSFTVKGKPYAIGKMLRHYRGYDIEAEWDAKGGYREYNIYKNGKHLHTDYTLANAREWISKNAEGETTGKRKARRK